MSARGGTGERVLVDWPASERLTLTLRTRQDALWNLELLGEHEGGTTSTYADAEQRLADQQVAALEAGLERAIVQGAGEDRVPT
jgi:hypothetical protein